MSKFLKVVCDCNENSIVFGDSKKEVKCKKCGKTIAYPSGGRAKIDGRIIEVFG